MSLETQIVNSPAPDREVPPSTEVIYDEEVQDIGSPLAIIHGGGDGEENDKMRTTYTIWKVAPFLMRPRMRLFGPSVVFSATGSLKPDKESSSERQNGYMESGVPSGINLLESFGNDSMLGGIKPRLSAMRVSSVAPVTQTKDSYPTLRSLPNLSQKIYPAIHTRVRFARPNTVPPSAGMIALLEIDFTPYFDCEISVNKITLSIPEGQVEDLNNAPGLSLPLSCVAHDHVTFMYHLAPQESDIATKNPARELAITIECTALVRPGECIPKLSMAWTTALDFTLPVNPGFGSGVPKPFHRAHRPSQISIDGASFVPPSVSRPDSLLGLEAAAKRATEATIPDYGITMTFTAPEGPIYPGDEFVWTVFVVNRTTTAAQAQLASSNPIAAAAAAARKLALLVIPRRRRNDSRVLRPPSTAGIGAKRKSVTTIGGDDNPEQQIADAVLDENIVHAMQRSSLVDSTEVVCLSADVRVGPLAPNACHVVELRFLALKEGIVGVECVRVVDLGSQEHVDVRELPVMVIEKRDDD